MDAFEVLTADHREIEDRLARLPPGDQAAFDDLADWIAIHVTIEERHFYPAVKARRTRAVLESELQDHLELKRILTAMLWTELDAPAFTEQLERLRQHLLPHHREEESVLFPEARALLDDQARRALGAEMEATIAALDRMGSARRLLPAQTDAPAEI